MSTMNAQNVKKCAAPGIDHFSSLRWPNTSTSWALARCADAVETARRGLPGPDQPEQEEHPAARRRRSPRPSTTGPAPDERAPSAPLLPAGGRSHDCCRCGVRVGGSEVPTSTYRPRGDTGPQCAGPRRHGQKKRSPAHCNTGTNAGAAMSNMPSTTAPASTRTVTMHPPGGRRGLQLQAAEDRPRGGRLLRRRGRQQRRFHEGLNLASIWKLPVLFVCENNQFATEVPFSYAGRQSRRRRPRRDLWHARRRGRRQRRAGRLRRPRGEAVAPGPRRRRADAARMQDLSHPAPRRGDGRLRLPHPRGGRGVEDALPDRAAHASTCSRAAGRRPSSTAIEARDRGEVDASRSSPPRPAPWPEPATRRDARLRRAAPASPPPAAGRRTARSRFMQATLEALHAGDGREPADLRAGRRASASAAATSRPPPGCTSSYGPSACATRRSASAASSAWRAARR